jgi:hypothetical protein
MQALFNQSVKIGDNFYSYGVKYDLKNDLKENAYFIELVGRGLITVYDAEGLEVQNEEVHQVKRGRKPRISEVKDV